MTPNNDTERQPKPVCPRCGHVEHDAWEIDFGGADGTVDIQCGECNCEYECTRQITCYYTTTQKGKVNDTER